MSLISARAPFYIPNFGLLLTSLWLRFWALPWVALGRPGLLLGGPGGQNRLPMQGGARFFENASWGVFRGVLGRHEQFLTFF